MKDRTALVTGASMGIGKAVAQALVAEGAKVVIAARHSEALDTAVEEIRRNARGEIQRTCGRLFHAPGGGSRLVADAADHLGRIDILVNAIGMARGGDFLTLSDAHWDESLSNT